MRICLFIPSYDKFWRRPRTGSAVSMHILTGHSYHSKERKGVERYRGKRQPEARRRRQRAFRFHFLGVLERYPKLKLVSVENESGWLPSWSSSGIITFAASAARTAAVHQRPSEHVRNQVFPASSTIRLRSQSGMVGRG